MKTMHRARRSVVALAAGLVVVVLSVLTGCGGGDKNEAKPKAVAVNSAGRVGGTNAYIAIVSDGKIAAAEICDGKNIGAAFNGPQTGNVLDIRSARGARLHADLARGGATGTVTLASGRRLAFTTRPVHGNGGLYRARKQLNGMSVTAGWVVLSDGEQRGWLLRGNTQSSVAHLDPTKGIVGDARVGTLEVQLISPKTAANFNAGS